MTTTCKVCYDVSDPSNFRELSCGHSFCLTCLRNYLEIKIHKEKVSQSEILCLEFSCGQPILIHQIQEIIPAELFAKYKAKYQESILEAKVEEKSTKVRIYDELFDYLVYKNGWKECPVCGTIIEKTGTACDYVNCQSNKCMKKTMICYVCGEKCDKKHLINDRCPTRRKKVKEVEEDEEEEKEKKEGLIGEAEGQLVKEEERNEDRSSFPKIESGQKNEKEDDKTLPVLTERNEEQEETKCENPQEEELKFHQKTNCEEKEGQIMEAPTVDVNPVYSKREEKAQSIDEDTTMTFQKRKKNNNTGEVKMTSQDEIGEQKSILGNYVENSLVIISNHELFLSTVKDAVQKKEEQCCFLI